MSELRQSINSRGLILIVIGSCIGSGIFLTPSEIANELSQPSLIILLWILGGLITLSGALSYAELSSRFPSAGGVYVYLREAFGRYPAFLFGWVVLTAVTSGALAALALAFTRFLVAIIPEVDDYKLPIAAGVIALTTFANIFGVQVGQFFSNLFTSLKVMGILFVIVAGLFLVKDGVEVNWEIPSIDGNILHHFFLALTGVYWSFGGWQHATYISSEVINPEKNIARAMLAGSFIVMAVYILSNLAYMNALSIPEIASSEKVAADVLGVIFPGTGGKIMACIVCISVFGTIAIYTMTAPRIYFAMAKDKVFFPFLAKVHPKYKTPINAILIQSAWAILLLFFWGTFKDLISYVTFTEGIFLALAALAVIVIRKKFKGTPHAGFKSPLYPILPLFYFAVSIAFLSNGLIANPIQALAALIIFGAGSIVFFLIRKQV